MPRILLINPNSNEATTRMMVTIAGNAAGDRVEVVGATATRSPKMIIEPIALAAAAAEVIEIALANQDAYDGIIVAAFGDPGLDEIRARSHVPAVGIAESAMLEAADAGRRFGVATTTPDLADQINARARDLGLGGQYTGIRLTDGDPNAVVADPERLRAALAKAVQLCIERDSAEAVIIGGGPLAQAALQLQPLFPVPLVVPISAAVNRIVAIMSPSSSGGRAPPRPAR
jgi:Asp/Glu/hydantoin racemase